WIWSGLTLTRTVVLLRNAQRTRSSSGPPGPRGRLHPGQLLDDGGERGQSGLVEPAHEHRADSPPLAHPADLRHEVGNAPDERVRRLEEIIGVDRQTGPRLDVPGDVGGDLEGLVRDGERAQDPERAQLQLG